MRLMLKSLGFRRGFGFSPSDGESDGNGNWECLGWILTIFFAGGIGDMGGYIGDLKWFRNEGSGLRVETENLYDHK